MKPMTALFVLAALVAFVVTQFSFATSVSLLFAAGFLALTVADYTRSVRPLALEDAAKPVALPRRERLGLAA